MPLIGQITVMTIKNAETLLNAARNASASGQSSQAAQFWAEVLSVEPLNAEALNALGNALVAQGKPKEGLDYLNRAEALVSDQPSIPYNTAAAHLALNEPMAALTALDRALTINPYFIAALYQKASLLDVSGNKQQAVEIFRNFLKCLPPQIDERSNLFLQKTRAEQVVAKDDQSLLDAISGGLTELHLTNRVHHAIAILTGRTTAYVQNPTFLTVPQLPAVPFFDRNQMEWLPDLEAATDEIEQELRAIMPTADESFEPYVAFPDGVPLNQWVDLNNSPTWDAFHLWREGKRIEENCRTCPATAAVIEKLPLAYIPHRAPNVFFSRLRAGGHIPPHTGVTNLRATVHLGLIIPAGCRYRVGHDWREWQRGVAWAFDDTIEHEARNDSERDRIILIIDSWNPFLSAEEQTQFTELLEIYDRHRGRGPSWDD
jgi:aspartate beta-hydroxylase